MHENYKNSLYVDTDLISWKCNYLKPLFLTLNMLLLIAFNKF